MTGWKYFLVLGGPSAIYEEDTEPAIQSIITVSSTSWHLLIRVYRTCYTQSIITVSSTTLH
jgi:hypothetical protein